MGTAKHTDFRKNKNRGNVRVQEQEIMNSLSKQPLMVFGPWLKSYKWWWWWGVWFWLVSLFSLSVLWLIQNGVCFTPQRDMRDACYGKKRGRDAAKAKIKSIFCNIVLVLKWEMRSIISSYLSRHVSRWQLWDLNPCWSKTPSICSSLPLPTPLYSAEHNSTRMASTLHNIHSFCL